MISNRIKNIKKSRFTFSNENEVLQEIDTHKTKVKSIYLESPEPKVQSKQLDLTAVNQQNLQFELEKSIIEMIKYSPHREFYLDIEKAGTKTNLSLKVIPIPGSA